MNKLPLNLSVALIGCAATALWMAIFAIIEAVLGNWATTLVFIILCLINATSVASIYQRIK